MRTYIVDAFTDRVFRGNPAGVCMVESPLSDETMLHIAQELNLSETAFVQAAGPEGTFAIRFFSPKMEIALCGHATMASGRAVFDALGMKELVFRNIQGLDLAVSVTEHRIDMVFPAYGTRPAEAPAALLSAMGLEAIKHAVFNEQTRILLLEIEDAKALARLTPDFGALQRSHSGINGVLVTARSGADGYDFHSRYFWPWSGTNEDPVTGGTHTFLTPYWAERLGKRAMKSFQASARSGFMNVELVDGKVRISSQAVVVFRGSLSI